jgi:hypothetical protein
MTPDGSPRLRTGCTYPDGTGLPQIDAPGAATA